jgi:N-acetylmuramoyl-L-alanine amidase
MAQWARALLVTTMLAWTAMTAVAGWYAFRGDGATAAAEDAFFGTLDVAAPDAPRAVRPLTVAQARVELAGTPLTALLPEQPPHPEEPVRATGSLQPVPAHAASAGIDRRTKSVDVYRPLTRAAAPGTKGVVVLDPGHGRGDPGAVHYYKDGTGRYYTEAQSNQRNAELIRDELRALGYEVYLTREGAGQGPEGPLALQFITSDLYARVALARAVDADVYLALHGNGASVRSIRGPETWYCGRHEEGAANEDLARRVQQAMMDALHEYGYDPPDRGIKEDAESHHSGDFCQFVVTRESAVPAALLEFLFLSNAQDAAVLIDERSHVLMAGHVAAAIDAFMRDRGAAR